MDKWSNKPGFESDSVNPTIHTTPPVCHFYVWQFLWLTTKHIANLLVFFGSVVQSQFLSLSALMPMKLILIQFYMLTVDVVQCQKSSK